MRPVWSRGYGFQRQHPGWLAPFPWRVKRWSEQTSDQRGRTGASAPARRKAAPEAMDTRPRGKHKRGASSLVCSAMWQGEGTLVSFVRMGGRVVEGSGLEIRLATLRKRDFSVSQRVLDGDLREHILNKRCEVAQKGGTPRDQGGTACSCFGHLASGPDVRTPPALILVVAVRKSTIEAVSTQSYPLVRSQ
jgi:hypothetical protein